MCGAVVFNLKLKGFLAVLKEGGVCALAVIRLIAKMVLITVLDVTPSQK